MKIFKVIKKNQIAIYIVALMLVTAGYLNYKSGNMSIQTYSDPEVTYKENLAEIGDAALVSSNEIKENNTNDETVNESISNAQTENAIDTQNTQLSSEQTRSTSANFEEYFSKSKLERDTMYSQMLETYQNIVNSSTVSEDQRSMATQEITNINNTKNAIMICENLLGTKGFEKNIVFVNGDSVSVVVKVEEELEASQVAQIQNVISREMNVEIENINITQKN